MNLLDGDANEKSENIKPSPNAIVVLDSENAKVHIFPYIGDAEIAYENWLNQIGLRGQGCNWMATTLHSARSAVLQGYAQLETNSIVCGDDVYES